MKKNPANNPGNEKTNSGFPDTEGNTRNYKPESERQDDTRKKYEGEYPINKSGEDIVNKQGEDWNKLNKQSDQSEASENKDRKKDTDEKQYDDGTNDADEIKTKSPKMN